MSKATLLLTAVVLGLSFPALAAGKGGGGGQNASSHTNSPNGNPTQTQQQQVRKAGTDGQTPSEQNLQWMFNNSTTR